MGTADREIDKKLSQLNQKLSQTDQYLDHLVQECKAKGSRVIQIFKMAVEELNASQENLKEEFYDLLTPFYQPAGGDNGNNIDNLDLSHLQEEVLRVFGTRENDDELVVGLVEDLEGFKKRADGIHESVVELMTDFNVVPKSNEVEKIKPFKEVEMEKIDEGFKGKENEGFRLGDVAIEMYGFPGDVAFHIDAALGFRKLIQNDYLFHIDEVKLMNLDQGEDEDEDFDPFWQKSARERIWVKVKRLKRIFKDLQKKIRLKNGEHDLNVAAKDGINGDNEDPESLRVSFLRVTRNWIFRLESVLFDLIYELYHTLSGNQIASAIFEDYKVELKKLMEINNGMVPITVHKFIYMVENSREFQGTKMASIMGPPTTAATGSTTFSKMFHKKMIELKDLIDLVHKIILRLKLVLLTSSGLSNGERMTTADESDSIEIMLGKTEDEVRDLEVKINWAKSELKIN